MDEKLNQAEDHPVPAADPTPQEADSPAPTVDTDQGVSTTVENTSNQVPSSEGAEAQTGQDEEATAAADSSAEAETAQQAEPSARSEERRVGKESRSRRSASDDKGNSGSNKLTSDKNEAR